MINDTTWRGGARAWLSARLLVVAVAAVREDRRGVDHGGLVDLGVHGVAADGDDGVEAVVVVGGVVHGALGAVGLQQRVLALHHVAVALLVLVFHVAGVAVVDAVLERVLGVGLGT